MDEQTQIALMKYMDAIVQDYENWCGEAEIRQERIDEFISDLHFSQGNKYIKVIMGGSVHSFVVNTDKDAKFKRGDILMAAGWAAPARNFARGNIFGNYAVRWTGPAI